MTSLIFGSIYLAHKGATCAYRDKQRRKNYERWEDLRDEYDAQKKITRETRSLEIQRVGSVECHDQPPIVSLRDLQEANDARTSWRPQESWEHSAQGSTQVQPQPTVQAQQTQGACAPLSRGQQRADSASSAYWRGRGEIRPQRTGCTWDDGLPAPLPVTRRSFDESDASQYKSLFPGLSIHRQSSMRSEYSSNPSPLQTPFLLSEEPESMDPFFIQQLTGAPAMYGAAPIRSNYMEDFKGPVTSVQPIQPHTAFNYQVPGGRMAELIEKGY